MRFVTFNPYRALGVPGARYIKPEHWFREREAVREADWVLFPETWQVNALVYALGKRIFPSLPSYHLGRDKIEMTRAFEACVPQHLPRTLILPAGRAAVEQVCEELSFPLVLKEPRNARGMGVFRVEDERALREHAARLDVLYVQELLPIERDVRVVWVGDGIVTAYWRRGADGFLNNVSQGGTVDFGEIPERALELVRLIAPRLGIDYAGFDIAMVGGWPYLLEFNLFFGNEALNARGIRLAARILDYLSRRTPSPREPEPRLPKAV
ncbi:MAG: hypothetical protein Kow006_03770 [Gammaproteobacteria bacterium]